MPAAAAPLPNRAPRHARLETSVLFVIAIAPHLLNGFYNPLLADRPALFWSVDVLGNVVLQCVIFAVGFRRGLFTRSDLGLDRRVAGRRSDAAFVGCLVLIPPVLFRADGRSREFGVATFERNYLAVPFAWADMVPDRGPQTGGWRLIAVVYLAASAGVTEELIFRGLLRRTFGGGGVLRAVAFVIASTVTFTAVHWEAGVIGMSEASGFGLAAAMLFALTRSLWPLVVGHALIDLRYFVG